MRVRISPKQMQFHRGKDGEGSLEKDGNGAEVPNHLNILRAEQNNFYGAPSQPFISISECYDGSILSRPSTSLGARRELCEAV